MTAFGSRYAVWSASGDVRRSGDIFSGKEGKYIVKKAVEDLLPREIVYRPKMGFPTPLRQWLRDSRADRIFSVLTARDGLLASCCEPRRIEELIEGQKSGRNDATDRVWRLLNLHIWGDIFLTGKRGRQWEGLMPPPADRTPRPCANCSAPNA